MFSSFKSKITLFLSVVLALGTYYFYTNQHTILGSNTITTPEKHTQNSNESCLEDSRAAQEILQKISQEEELIWDLLKTGTKITKQECYTKQQQDHKHYKNSLKKNWQYKRTNYPKLSQETIAFVENVLNSFGLNSQEIQIVPYKGLGSPAAADDSTIFINEEEFKQYSPEACKFFIAHEISHLKAQDDSVYATLMSLANRKRVPQKQQKNALNAFRRFQENRADVYALMHGGELYAKGAFEFFHKLQELDGGDNPGITHPKTSQRIETAKNICLKMGWNIPALA